MNTSARQCHIIKKRIISYAPVYALHTIIIYVYIECAYALLAYGAESYETEVTSGQVVPIFPEGEQN